MRREVWETVVIGTGLAGMVTALALAPRPTLLLTKTPSLRSGSTPWAQGGVAFPADSADIPIHIQDTLTSAAGRADPSAVRFLITKAPEALVWLESLGFRFDQDTHGHYSRGQEGAHTVRRILHSNGDSTGASLFDFFQNLVQHAPHITLRTSTLAVEILTGNEHEVRGLWTWDQHGPTLVETRHLIIASGGYGQVFARTTAPPENTGDGTAIAILAGATLRDAEMVQFHPTGLDIDENQQVPLLTEALRGDGATLVTSAHATQNQKNDLQPLFINHPQGSLGPRDLVARAVFQRQRAGYPVWLDARKVTDLEQHFPTATTLARLHGWDPLKDLIPVTPVAHYIMGGVACDLTGATAVPGLFVVGEAGSTGVHGANRLASNSLLECLVFGRACAENLVAKIAPPSTLNAQSEPLMTLPSRLNRPIPDLARARAYRTRLQKLVFDGAGPLRNATDLTHSLELVRRLQAEWRREGGDEPLHAPVPAVFAFIENENLVLIAEKLLTAALANGVNQGAHFRTDVGLA